MSHNIAPLVLVHGFTGQAIVWNDVCAELAHTCTCYAMDLPGHGRYANDSIDDSFTFSGVTTRITSELARLGMRRFNLWGYSLGGRIALHIALRSPELVRRLILESASAGLADPLERASRLQSDEHLADQIESGGLESFVDYWSNIPLFESQKSLPHSKQVLGREIRLRGSPTGYAAALRGFSAGRQEALHNRLRELTMPVLVLAGELDEKYCLIGESMAGSIPNAQFRIIPGAGHAPHWERPVESAAIVADFIRGTYETER